MAEGSILKALSRETKALIVVSEFEARRMPLFQLRAVLSELVSGPEERKTIVDLIENDLKATGYHPDQIAAFLGDLLGEAPDSQNIRVTRRVGVPFALDLPCPAAPGEQLSPPRPAGVYPQPSSPSAPTPPPAPAPQEPAVGTVTPLVGLGPRKPTGPPLRGVTRVAGYRPPGGIAPLSQPPAQAPGAPGTGPPSPPAAAPPESLPGSLTRSLPMVGGTRVVQARVPLPRDTFAFAARTPTPLPEGMPKPKVLLADDDKRIRIVFRMGLERLGCTVLEAGDGSEAWKLIQEGGIDLVVLDMKMPGLHGLEVLSRMVDRHLTPPVVICSAYDQLKDEFVVSSYPKLRYLIKPVAAEALENAVRELLGLKTK